MGLFGRTVTKSLLEQCQAAWAKGHKVKLQGR
jgi:hypothetical protein